METKVVPIKPEAENQKAFGVLRCPKPGCGKTLFEMEKSFWIKEPEGSQCRRCSGAMVQLLSYYNEKAMGQLVIRFWCPEKIALVGYDDIERGRVVSPSLTTIRQPLYQMGQESVDVLIEKIEFQDKEPVQRRYAPELIARQTA